MTSNFNLLWLIFKWCFPLTLVLVPLVAIYGYLQPWQPASSTLRSYIGQTPMMVGFSYRVQNNTQTSSRSYVLFPSFLSEPKIVTIQKINDSIPTVTVSLAGFLIFTVWLLVSFIGSWWFWLRGIHKSHLTHQSTVTPRGVA